MKILNFGSLNLDYVYAVDHFVRAGETLASYKLETFCGGKGLNQSIAFAGAGAEIYHAGCIGKEGTMLTDMLVSRGVNTELVEVKDGVSCGHAIIQVNTHGENCILLFGGANHTVTEAQVDAVLARFSEGDMLMLQNEINNLDYIVRAAKARGMVVVLNPSPFNEVITALDLNLIDWIIINETEGCEITGKTESDDILQTLHTRYPNMKVVLTLGKHGAIYAYGNDRASHGIIDAKVVDTTAAGDTFTGYFFTAVMSGDTPANALRIASAASAIAVSRPGAGPSIPNRDEVLELLKHVAN